ncbi:MAG: hypothetical protein IJM56_01195, partial [Clostridia bacterium]|nr:hypothetical protein [Clostridia bacterium]
MKSYAKKLGFLTLAIIICLSCTSVYADDAAYISAIEKMAGLNGKIDCSTNILSYINNNMDYLKSEGGNVASQINISFNLAQFRKNVRAYENNSKQFISLQHLQVIEIYDITYLVNVPCEAILLTDGESKIDYMGLRYG